MTAHIRRALPTDVTAMIHELSHFERAGDQCTVAEKQIRAALLDQPTTLRGHVHDFAVAG